MKAQTRSQRDFFDRMNKIQNGEGESLGSILFILFILINNPPISTFPA
jgi:hypothetical protein